MWKRFEATLNVPEARIDNNWVENAMRPAALGRKNWLFLGSPKGGGNRMEVFMSLAQSCQRLGANPFQVLDAEEAARRGGAPVIQAGVYEPTVASLQPGRLALGLRRVALEKGVRIYERSPVTRIERGPRPRLETARGSLVSDKLVLALNAWAAELREFRLTLLPVAADLLITDPLPAALEGSGLASGPASKAACTACRPTPRATIC